MTTHDLARQLLDAPAVELPTQESNMRWYARLMDYAGIGRPHRMIAWYDDQGTPRSVVV